MKITRSINPLKGTKQGTSTLRGASLVEVLIVLVPLLITAGAAYIPCALITDRIETNNVLREITLRAYRLCAKSENNLKECVEGVVQEVKDGITMKRPPSIKVKVVDVDWNLNQQEVAKLPPFQAPTVAKGEIATLLDPAIENKAVEGAKASNVIAGIINKVFSGTVCPQRVVVVEATNRGIGATLMGMIYEGAVREEAFLWAANPTRPLKENELNTPWISVVGVLDVTGSSHPYKIKSSLKRDDKYDRYHPKNVLKLGKSTLLIEIKGDNARHVVVRLLNSKKAEVIPWKKLSIDESLPISRPLSVNLGKGKYSLQAYAVDNHIPARSSDLYEVEFDVG